MAQPEAEKPENASPNNRRVVFGCLAALVVMTAVTAVSPKLYSMFCQATGYGGTTQRAEANAGKVLDRIFKDHSPPFHQFATELTISFSHIGSS